MACRPSPVCQACCCLCCHCQCRNRRPLQVSVPAEKTCRLRTNETACYQKLYATIDSHSFNRAPDDMRRLSCLQRVDAGKEAWQALAYPHCERNRLASSYCLETCPTASTYGKCVPHHDPRILPYGLPPESYDVRKRADWVSAYANEAFRYF